MASDFSLEEVKNEQVDLENIPIEEVFTQLKCTREGLTSEEGEKRLQIFGYNKLEEKKESKLLKFMSLCGILFHWLWSLLPLWPLFWPMEGVDSKVGLFSRANYKDTSMVSHYNRTGRWISTFRGIRGWDDSHVFIGNMKRGIDVISVASEKIVLPWKVNWFLLFHVVLMRIRAM